MTTIDKRTRTLFFTTSPRSPMKMAPEIKLLTEEFSGARWNRNPTLQAAFMTRLAQQNFFESHDRNPRDPAFSARDRITRGPKALGFVDLEPTIQLTPAGKAFVQGEFPEEALLRQLVKFQLPSPYHRLSKASDQRFQVKPYLEMLRLIRHFGSLTFDELMIFGLQLTDYHLFDTVAAKIERFRSDKALNTGKYKKFRTETIEREIRGIYAKEIGSGNVDTRESDDDSTERFIRTKRRNMRDYTDACFRYLRATGVVSISQSGHSLSIAEGKTEEVDHLLNTIPREPMDADDTDGYKRYLFNATLPALYSDNRDNLLAQIDELRPEFIDAGQSVTELKSLVHQAREERKERILQERVRSIKEQREYDDIQKMFDGIKQKDVYYDRPLMFEYNTWRAMTMIDGGNIVPNFHLDDDGQPLSTATGGMPDILCHYGDFDVTVEVTLQTGSKQYDNEGEPVARHLGETKKASGKDTYCLFIAPTINPATVAYFYTLYHTNIAFYGGKAEIIPLKLDDFRKMVEASYRSDYRPQPERIRRLFDRARMLAYTTKDEEEDAEDWYEQVRQLALRWLD